MKVISHQAKSGKNTHTHTRKAGKMLKGLKKVKVEETKKDAGSSVSLNP